MRADDSTRRDDADASALSAEVRPTDDELPPVKPPSAGFIAQLFVVPGLIVLAIVGVVGLFGKLSESEQDWRELVQELRSSNQHRRWRAAHGLAHLLMVDQERPAGEQRLADNPRVAQALVALLDEELASRSSADDDVKQQAFVARTLGNLDVPEVVLPALQRAMQPQHALEVRKNAIASLAVMFGRHAEPAPAGRPRADLLLDRSGLVADVIEVSHDSEALIRQLAAFTLGLLPTDESRHRLEVLLSDSDAYTRENAAFGLARQRSTAGWPVFRRVLLDAGQPQRTASPRHGSGGSGANDARDAAAIRLVALKNSLKAVGDLAGEWTPEQRDELYDLVRPLADDHAEDRIRTDARQTLMDLNRG
ncbi:MAG TPA: hypothetical protein VML55_16390 [Planctomycetaceae bacterium]|nr:hypothetical protein [Planctomycetaceae bacterium]